MISLLESMEAAMTATGLRVYWPDELVLEADGTLTPPSDLRFAIIWAGDANPHDSWTPDAFSTSTIEVSAGGASLQDCFDARELVLTALNAQDYPRVRTNRPISSNRPGNRLWIASLLFRGVLDR